MTQKASPQTKLIHSDYQAPDGFAAFPMAIHHASSVLFENVAAMRARNWQDKSAYTYGLHGTPTTFTLEARLAEVEGGQYCVLAPSGLAAIAMVDFAFLKTGDDVLIPDNVYGPNRELGSWLKQSFGITARFYDPLIGERIAECILPNTRLIWIEAPGSISMEVPDVPAICKVAREKNVLTAIDNTWSAGIAFKAFDHGVDISVQALTKYQSGSSDVLMGAVITREKKLSQKIDIAHMRLGLGVGADDAYLVLRSLPTLRLRFDAHDKAARVLANWLKTRPEISKVLHPALPDCPGHGHWKRDFIGAGGLFSVLFDSRFSEEQTDRFVDSLKLFKIGYSWGGVNSLCVPYRMRGMRQDWNEAGQLVRLNIGLEDPMDLIADLEQAFDTLSI